RLTNMPQGIAGMYDLILKRVHGKHQSSWDVEMRKRILMWIAMAYVPVSIQEIQLVCAVSEGRLFEPEKLKLLSESQVQQLCGSLIETYQANENIEDGGSDRQLDESESGDAVSVSDSNGDIFLRFT